MASAARLLMLLLATLAYPGGVAGDVSTGVLVGAVVGTFVGTVLLCALLVAAGYWFYARKRQQQQKHDVETPNTHSSK